MEGYSTWNDVMKSKKITSIQDPILEMDIEKEDFNKIYKDIVVELQGNDDVLESYIDYYFTNCWIKYRRKILICCFRFTIFICTIPY